MPNRTLTRRITAALAAAACALGGAAAVALNAPSAASAAPAAGSLVPIAPARILDTRVNLGGTLPGSNETVHLQILGKGGVPASGVLAVLVNVTATQPTGYGYVTAYPDGTIPPLASNLNFVPGQTVPNLALVPVAANGKIALFNGSPGSTHLIADVSGYIVAGDATAAGTVTGLPPTRIMDTRSGLGGGKLAPGAARPLTVTGGSNDVPAGVSSVILNVTATQPTDPGYVSVYAFGAPAPTSSNLNVSAGETVANLVIAPVGADGQVTLLAGYTSTHLIADIVGYVRAGSASQVGALSVLSPTRILDTRTGLGSKSVSPGVGMLIPPGGTISLPVGGDLGIPFFGDAAVVLNVTVTQPSGAGYVTVYGDDGAPPTASTLNYVAGQTVPNLAVAPVGANGKVAFYNGGNATIHLIADVFGWVVGEKPSPGWTQPLPAEPFQGRPTAVSCPSSVFCMAVDATGSALTFDGSTWSQPTAVLDQLSPVDTFAPGLRAVSCASPAFCVALSASAVFTYNGSQWSGPVSLGAASLTSASCATASFCVVSDRASGAVWTWTGAAWTGPVGIAPPVTGTIASLTSVSCVTASFCMALDAGRAISFNGTAWASPVQVVAPNTGSLQAVSCASATACTAVNGQSLYAYRYNGTTWTADSSFAGFGSRFAGVSCADVFCAAVTSAGDVFELSGGVWGAKITVDPGRALSGVSCASAAFCAAVDSSGLAVTRVGGTWTAPTLADPQRGSLMAVSCPTTTFCAALDSGGPLLSFDGSAWTTGPDSPLTYVMALSCVSPTFCVGLGSDSGAAVYDGATWSVATRLGPPVGPPGSSVYGASISCVSASFCIAVGTAFNAGSGTSWFARFDGIAWTAAHTIATTNLSSVSCPTATFCAAIGSSQSGPVTLRFDGATWSAPIATPATIASVISCASATFCAAVGGNGAASTFNGATWSTPVDAMSLDYQASNERITSLSCAPAQLCVAVTSGPLGSQVTEFNGSSWTPGRRFSTVSMESVSCPTAQLCIAVGWAGRYVARV